MAQVDLADRTILSSVQKNMAAPGQSQWVGQRHGWLGRTLGYVGLGVCLLLIGLPVYWMTIGAFKPTPEVYRIPPSWLPLEPTLSNFARAWQSQPFDRYYLNTTIVTLFGSGFELLAPLLPPLVPKCLFGNASDAG